MGSVTEESAYRKTVDQHFLLLSSIRTGPDAPWSVVEGAGDGLAGITKFRRSTNSASVAEGWEF